MEKDASHSDISDWRNQMTITVEQFAKIMRVGRNTAYHSIRKREVEAIRVGGCIRVCVPALLRKLEGC